MFFVSVHFDHHFYFKTVASKNFSQIHANIAHELEDRSNNLFLFFNIIGLISSIFFIMILLRAIKYKHKFLTKDRFDNFYINHEFLAIDEQRKSNNMETILPFTSREKRKYIRLTSIYLIRKEKLRVARSAFFLIISSIQLGSIILMDYSLFWILLTIRRIGKQEKGVVMPPMISLGVEGSGLLAEMYRGMFEAFDPMREEYAVDPIPCLPLPFLPDFDQYLKIFGVIFMCWVLLIFEPYGLRLRQIVMNSYYPERARNRAIWLYNNIIRKRSNFFKIARRQARRKLLKDKSGVIEENFGCMDYIRARLGHYRILRFLLGSSKDTHCILCGKTLIEKDDFIDCVSPNCKGKYCNICFNEIRRKCFLCHEPIDYGDSSDYSEEK